MVGLSVVLEGQKGRTETATASVINKANMKINKNINPLSSSALPYQPTPYNNYPNFLEKCFLCKQKLLQGKDIYMYKGDKGFCSVECRYNQIMMDEIHEKEISGKEIKCSMSMVANSASVLLLEAQSLPTKKRTRNISCNRQLSYGYF